MAFSRELRRRQFDRILAAEFAGGSTPERGKQFISGWFFGAPVEDIDRNAARTFFAWAWFNHASTSACSASELEEVDRDVATFEKLGGMRFRDDSVPSLTRPIGVRSQGLRCMRPNVDDTAPFSAHKPLLLYLVTEYLLGRCSQGRLLSGLGFRRRTARSAQHLDAPLHYWHRSPADPDASTTAPPLVIFHGIGLGYSVGYADLLRELVAAGGGRRTILAVELPHIRMTIPHDYGANPAVSVRAIRAMLQDVAARSSPPDSMPSGRLSRLRRRFGDAALRRPGVVSEGDGAAAAPRADFVAHSYGTLAVAHMLKQAGECVRSATLIDPVCVGAHRATLCRSFLYEPEEEASIEGRVKHYLIHSDPRLVGVLMRNFYWYENVLWLDDEDLDGGTSGTSGTSDGTVSLFIAEKDRYIDGEIMYADAMAAVERRGIERRDDGRRQLRAVLWAKLDHGQFLQSAKRRNEVIESVLGD